MKKIYTLLLATLGVSVAAMAQREVDLQITLVTPASGATQQSGTDLNINAIIENLGPDSMSVGDTVLIQYQVNGNPVVFNSGGQQYNIFYFSNRLLEVGDTMHFMPSFPGISFTDQMNGTHNFCVVFAVVNQSADSVVDPNLQNNAGCNTVTFAGGTPTGGGGGVGVTTIEWSNAAVSTVAGVYPNPAVSSATFALNLGQNQDVAVKIVDLAGRVVLSENKGTLQKGENKITVNTTGLTPGLYLYQVTMGNHTATGKLNVAK